MINTPITPELLRGVAELESTDRGVRLHRLPAWVRSQFPDPQLLAMESQPSGVCLTFRTSATHVELHSHPTRLAYRGATRPRGRIDIMINGARTASDVLAGGDVIEVDLLSGETSATTGRSHTTTVTGVPPGEKQVEMWLPHNESVELVALRSNAPLHPYPEARPVWVHHGSSISHGSNALAPSEIWPVVAARRGDVALRNLGLGGSAMVDPFLARVIRDSPADLISVKLGINVVNLDAMRLRSFIPAVHGFLDTIRDGHPDTPLILISPIFCGIHENTPGPGAVDPETLGTDQVRFTATGDARDTSRLTLVMIRRELRALAERRSADPHLHYLDGCELFGPVDEAELPLPDALHPSPAAHRLIGERFAERIFSRHGASGHRSSLRLS